MVANIHPVFSHMLVGFLIHVIGEGDGILLSMSHHRYSEVIRVEFVHMWDRRVPFVKGISMVNNWPGSI